MRLVFAAIALVVMLPVAAQDQSDGTGTLSVEQAVELVATTEGDLVVEDHGLEPNDRVRVNGTVHDFPDPAFKCPSFGRRRLRIAKDGSVTATVDEIRPQP